MNADVFLLAIVCVLAGFCLGAIVGHGWPPGPLFTRKGKTLRGFDPARLSRTDSVFEKRP